MYKIGLVLAIAVVGGCAGESPESNERAQQVAADTASAVAAVNPHAGHVTGDTASGMADTTGAMADMDHASVAPAGPAAHAGHAGTQGGADGAADGQHSGSAGGVAAASAGGMDHSRHAAATSSQGGQSAAQSHASMGHVQSAATSPRGSVPADHSQHAAGAPGANAARTAAPAHQGMDHSRATPDARVEHAQVQGADPATAGAAPGMDKLRALVAELVQDSVVQRRIEEDSILRGQWEDPGVRQVILRRQ